MNEAQLVNFLIELWPKYVGIIMAFAAGTHVLINKTNYRAALGWFGFIILFPLTGSILYYIFGINRIHRKALKQRAQYGDLHINCPASFIPNTKRIDLIKTAESLGPFPATTMNSVTPLYGGDECFTSMLESIEHAKVSISLMTYIFDNDSVGGQFVSALARAQERGVTVRVLIDDIGSKGNRGIFSELNIQRIECLRFNTLNLLFRAHYMNLRNHRKLMLIDNEIAYTGGINISERYSSHFNKKNAVIDIHFKILGQSVKQFIDVFEDDWLFAKGEKNKTNSLPNKEETQATEKNIMQVIPDGPGKTSLRLRWHLIAAINNASKEIIIMTPYFLPDAGVATSLISAVLRGVKVKILIPKTSDHFYTGLAMLGNLRPFLEYKCEVYLTPGAFNHSKLFVIDDDLVLAGSSNWDDRSLRLNFELNFEVINPEFNSTMRDFTLKHLEKSNLYTLEEYHSRSFFKKVSHGLVRLLTPYL